AFGGDAGAKLGRAPSWPRCVAPRERLHAGARYPGELAADREVYPRIDAERGGVQIDLGHGGSRADQPAMARGPHVEGAAPGDDEIGLGDELGGERRGEPARDVEVPGIADEQALGGGR